ncbi:MAG: hypothetical protein WBQ23_10260 [Bacteroidota bacterium]
MKEILILLVAIIILSSSLRAQQSTVDASAATGAPSTMFYQGYAATAGGSALPSGSYQVSFALYDVATGGTALWQEIHPSVQVKLGLFSVMLGQGSPAQPLTLPFDKQYYLGIRIGTNPEFAPRIALSTTPYSFRARTAEDAASVDWSVIRNVPAGFADGVDNTGGSGSAGVSTLNGKTGDLSISAGSNVTIDNSNPANIVINAAAASGGGDMYKAVYDVDNNNRSDGADMAYAVQNASITTEKLADGAVTLSKVEDGAINSTKIADGAINSTKIEDGAVTQSKIADGAIVATKIADNAVTQSKIMDGAIKEAKLADNAVSGVKLLDGAVSASKIADGSVSIMKLASTEAAAGRVLTYTGSAMVWQTPAAGGGLTLPFSGSATNTAFAISSVKGTAVAGYTSSNQNAVEGITSHPAGTAVRGRNTNTGKNGSLGGVDYAVHGKDSISGNWAGLGGSVIAVDANVSGSGKVGLAVTATNGAEGIYSISSGLYAIRGVSTRDQAGVAGEFVSYSGTNNLSLSALNTGNGRAGLFQIQNPNNSQLTLGVYSDGLGYGGYFSLTNTSNPSHAIYAKTVGTGKAGYFEGNVQVTGTLSKGSGTFMIDHPLDPENKYLYHSFVESPDMMNVYNGNAVLDGSGEAWIDLPSYFEALNSDFRYLLTAIGAPGPNLYIAQEIRGNRFKVAGGQPNSKVSWQVTGVRQDKFAQKHRVVPEVDKEAKDRGRYLHAKEWDQPADKAIDNQPEKSSNGNDPAATQSSPTQK